MLQRSGQAARRQTQESRQKPLCAAAELDRKTPVTNEEQVNMEGTTATTAQRLPPPDIAINFSQQMTEPMVHCAEAMSRGMINITEGYSRFLSTRLQRTSEAIADLTQCSNPTKAMEVNLKWFAEAVRDYTGESNRVVSVTGQIVQDMLQKTCKQ
jgi:hypothetical protein